MARRSDADGGGDGDGAIAFHAVGLISACFVVLDFSDGRRESDTRVDERPASYAYPVANAMVVHGRRLLGNRIFFFLFRMAKKLKMRVCRSQQGSPRAPKRRGRAGLLSREIQKLRAKRAMRDDT